MIGPMPDVRPDLNLFRVFASVMQHRSLAVAGRELGLTPSAVSHALTRLRTLVGDELFLPGKRGMQPTPRAVALAPAVATALGNLNVIMLGDHFDPAKSERVFNIGASDYSATCLLPRFVETVLQKAPGIRLRIMPIGRIDLIEQLDTGRLDLVISWLGLTPERVCRKPLVTDEEAVIVRSGHPLATGKPRLASLLSFPHLIVEFTGGGDEVDDGFFSERGFSRRIWQDRLLLENIKPERLERSATVTIPTFHAVPSLLRGTNMVSTVPLRLARLMVGSGELVILDLPYETEKYAIEAAWHQRGEHDLALQWLVQKLAETLA